MGAKKSPPPVVIGLTLFEVKIENPHGWFPWGVGGVPPDKLAGP